MNNSVFGAPGVFGSPSMFGAAELDPMFAASNPAHSSVFGVPAVGSVGRRAGGLAQTAGAAARRSGGRALDGVVTKVQVKMAQQRYRSARAASEKYPGNSVLRSAAEQARDEYRALKAQYEGQQAGDPEFALRVLNNPSDLQLAVKAARKRYRQLRRAAERSGSEDMRREAEMARQEYHALLAELKGQMRKNPRVVGRVGRGKGKTIDAKAEFAKKAAKAWEAGRLSDARIHMKSYEKQAASTEGGFIRKSQRHVLSKNKNRYIAWVKANYGDKLGEGHKTYSVSASPFGAKITKTTTKKAKFSKRYKGAKPGKVAAVAAQVAPSSAHTPGLDHARVVAQRRRTSRGGTVGRMMLGGPRVGSLLGLPPALRAARMAKMAGPVHRLRTRRKAGMASLPFKQALPQIAKLPRKEYRARRNQMLVDRTTEQVIERLQSDPEFINRPYEEKVAAAMPLAEAVDSELAAVEQEIGVAPPTAAEESEAIDEIMEEGDMAADWEGEYSDEEFYLDDEYAGVFGHFGADDASLTSRAEAAARAAVDAIEADVAATEATAEAAVAEEDEDSTRTMLMVGGGLVVAYFAAKHFGFIR